MTTLTEKQRDLMRYLQKEIDRTGGVAPSYREIGKAMGFSSVANVHRHIGLLVERGYLRTIPNRARAMEILRRIPDPSSNTCPHCGAKRENVI